MACHRILIVDDEPSIRSLVELVLEAVPGVEVSTAGDGLEALRLLAADPSIESMVLDLSMPGLSGLEVLREIDGAVATVVLTAKTDERTRLDCLAAGAEVVMTKPFDVLELAALIRGWCA